ncbi:MAG: FecR family protein [Candidatus Cryptobacteroides sp.]
MEHTGRIKELMQAYFQGNATADQVRELEAWVSLNGENRREFMYFKNIWEAEHPCFDPEQVLQTKASAGRKLRGKMYGHTFVSFWMKASAVLLLPVAAISVWLAVRNREMAQSVSGTEQTVAAAYGTVSNVHLPDGTVVFLNSGSKLSYNLSPLDNQRRVRLTGEAFFEVKSDKEHPFVVEAGAVDVVATGTEFNVEAYPGCTSRVTLVDGSVSVIRGSGTYPLSRGEQLVCDMDGTVSSIRTDTFKWTAWKDGIIAFRGDSLSYVFEKLSQIYKADIVIDDPLVREVQIRATFRDERLDEIMSLIEKCSPVVCVKTTESDGFDRVSEYHFSMKKM